MTFSIRQIVGVWQATHGSDPIRALFFTGYDSWPYWQRKAYDYILGCHSGHYLEMIVAYVCYAYLWPLTFPYAHTWAVDWVAKVVGFNLACEVIFYGFWHYWTYAGSHVTNDAKTHKRFLRTKFNPENQYEPDGGPVRMFSSSTGNLEREIFYTTLGWLQSSAFQCVIMWLWASGRLPYYDNFWAYPAWSIGQFLLVTYWREFHFYFVHRMIHPWWKPSYGLAQGDIGAFLYRWVHSLHHKSYNPGPFSGLSMHPVEHFFYYTCTLLCLIMPLHPIHHLYAKFHADLAPIGGHDGHGEPGGNGGFHWLHHHSFHVNYGVPLVDFDTLFGTSATCDAATQRAWAAADKGAKTLGPEGDEYGEIPSVAQMEGKAPNSGKDKAKDKKRV